MIFGKYINRYYLRSAPVLLLGLLALGMGLIGWSVALPTLLGAALGLWLDKHYPGGHSWTLALLAAGLVLGCFNAWRWVAKEDREIHHKETDRDA